MKTVGRKDPNQQWDAEDATERDGIRQVHTVTISNYPPLATTKAMNWGHCRKDSCVAHPIPTRRRRQLLLLPKVSDDNSLLLPFRFPIPRLLGLGLGHKLAVFCLAVPTTGLVIHPAIEIYPHL